MKAEGQRDTASDRYVIVLEDRIRELSNVVSDLQAEQKLLLSVQNVSRFGGTMFT